ncbi:Peroxiredoxin-5, mitochondrial, partial [Cyphellophora attinorum]
QVKEGDKIPSVELFRKNPGDKINIAQEIASGPALLIGVPAAFSPGCSEKHIPGYVARPDKLEEFKGKVYIIVVNDAFVTNAWAKSLGLEGTGITILGDADGKFVEELDVAFDATAILGNKRSKRFAIRTQDGVVKKVAVEPDNTGVTVSSLEQFLP